VLEAQLHIQVALFRVITGGVGIPHMLLALWILDTVKLSLAKEAVRRSSESIRIAGASRSVAIRVLQKRDFTVALVEQGVRL
jgi:hypothetical protein